jgi:hypothetical protein
MTSTTATESTPPQFEPANKSSTIVNLVAMLILLSGLANLWHVLFRGVKT